MKHILYFQCRNANCIWLHQLVIIHQPEIAPGVIDEVRPVCVCLHHLYRLIIRSEV